MLLSAQTQRLQASSARPSQSAIPVLRSALGRRPQMKIRRLPGVVLPEPLPQQQWPELSEQQQQQHHPDVSCAAGGAAAAADAPTPAYSADFIRRRLVVFVSIVIGYSCYYLTRNSLTYTAPVMVADPKLAMDITQIGAMTSIFPIAYGMSKFVSGVLGARFSPSVLLAGGLMATALINIAFGFGTSLTWFCFFWALNGTLQVRATAASR
eukprot:GHRQ01023903.1.p2 GENE.GHRQ01023903.1~~GHRQ01023903.1.p2  ORF type:complete len:210 (+),score=77.76 GHRQ01023903.1:228-857(+)